MMTFTNAPRVWKEYGTTKGNADGMEKNEGPVRRARAGLLSATWWI